MTGDEYSTEEAAERVAAVLPDALGGDFVVAWVLVADVILPDGQTGTWHLTPPELRQAAHLGLLEYAATQVRAAITRDAEPDA